MARVRYIATFLFTVISTILYAQVPTVQDCDGAIPVCQNVYSEANSYTGTGNYPNEINGATSCLGGGEVNDVWYTFTVQTSGNLCFTITPNTSADDYDWALYDLTNASCADIYGNPALEVACNFSGISGATGANGLAGAQNNPCVPVVAGQTFVLNVSNWSGTASGFTLDFSASTAAIFDNVSPTLDAIQGVIGCGDNTITFTFSENILCNTLSIADLQLTGPGGPYTITALNSIACGAGGTQENEFTITVSPPITTAGNYSLDLIPGAGFVQDLCGNTAAAGSLPFVVSNTIGYNITITHESCLGDNDGALDITGNGGVGPYTYDIVGPSGSFTNATGLFSNLMPGDYDITITDNGGCATLFTVTINPGILCCGADPGTTNANLAGQSGTNFVLCDGDIININSNNDFVHPADVGIINGNAYNPDLAFGIYSCPPTPGLDPLSDPCFLGVVPSAPGTTMSDQNVGGSGGGLLAGLLAIPGNNIMNNTIYFAPITLYNGPNLMYNTNCVEVGPPTQVQYLEPITWTNSCTGGDEFVTISGGHPEYYGGNYTLSNLTPAGASFNTTSIPHGGTVTITGMNYLDNYSFDVTDPNGCMVTVTGQYTCCPIDAGSATATINGQGTNNYILCDGDALDLTTNVDYSGLFGVAPGITYAIYTCPPTPGVDPALDPCYTGFVTGDIWNSSILNSGGSAGGVLGFLIGQGLPVVNNELWFAPLTLTDTTTLTYDLNCHDVGPAISATFLEPITYVATEDCINQEWDVTITGGYANMFGGNFTISNLVVVPANGGAALSTTSVADGGTVSVTGLVFGDVFTFDVTDPNGCTITVNGGPYTCCPADAGTASGNLIGDGITNFILCDGDFIDIQSNNDFTNSPGVAPGITYAIYACPPTPGTDPALDPCFTGFVTGTISTFLDQNIGGSGGGLLAFLIGNSAVPIVNNTIYYAPFTLIDTVNLLYDPTCFDVGPAIQVQYLEPFNNSGVSTPANCGNSDGSITITALGSFNLNPYQYELLGQGGLQASNVFTNLNAGTYDAVIHDANGCSDTIQVIVANTGAPVIDSVVVNDASCYEACDGDATIYVTGGTMPYIYTVNGVVQNGNNFFNNLCDTTLNISVTDNNGCIVTATDTVFEPTQVVFTDTATNLLCYQDSIGVGNITMVPSGGTPGYQFSIDGGNTFQAGNSFDDLGAGTYPLVVQDLNGCQATGSATITEPTELTWNFSSFDAICFGFCDGYAVVIPNGGTLPYTFTWTDGGGVQIGGNTPNINNLCAAQYSLNLTDANGCQLDTTFTIDAPVAVTITNVAITDEVCNGDCQGVIDISAPGAVNFSIDSGATFQTDSVFNGLCAGTYNIVVENINGCQAVQQVVVGQPAPVTIVVGNDTTICIGGTATLNAAASGGLGGFIYIWDQGLPPGVPATVTPNMQTTYCVYALDANGCPSPIECITVDLNPALSVTASPDTDICPGEQVTITANGGGGDGNLTYTWSNGMTGSSITVSPSVTTQYVVTVTDGCTTPSAQATSTVTVNPIPQVQFSADSLSGCVPLEVTFTNNGDPLLIGGNCLWDFGAGTSTDCAGFTYTFDTPGSYTVSLTYESPDGCVGTDTITNYINVYGNPTASFIAEPQQATILDPTFVFTNTSTGAVAYDWSFDIYGTSTAENPTWTFDHTDEPSFYEICLDVVNEWGCPSSTCQIVEVEGVFTLYVPNAFTPDGDGVNDFFFPRGHGFDNSEYTMLIFNRWGDLIFESYDLEDGWDGTHKNEPAQTDVYVWKLIVLDQYSGEKEEHYGHVTLLR